VLGVLQAADVIAWGTRRLVTGVPFRYGFEPIRELVTSGDKHHTEPWKPEWLREFGTNIALRIAEGKGLEEPTDEDLARR
jgi:hypothetical protein